MTELYHPHSSSDGNTDPNPRPRLTQRPNGPATNNRGSQTRPLFSPFALNQHWQIQHEARIYPACLLTMCRHKPLSHLQSVTGETAAPKPTYPRVGLHRSVACHERNKAQRQPHVSGYYDKCCLRTPPRVPQAEIAASLFLWKKPDSHNHLHGFDDFHYICNFYLG